jgi:hypothetical protein
MTIRPVYLFPDVERVLVQGLTGKVAATVRADVPNPRVLPFVLVRRTGGVAVSEVIDNALVTVEAWAVKRTDAAALAQATRTQIHALQGVTVDGTLVGRVRDVGGPGRLPDPDTDDERYTFLISVALRGTPL